MIKRVPIQRSASSLSVLFWSVEAQPALSGFEPCFGELQLWPEADSVSKMDTDTDCHLLQALPLPPTGRSYMVWTLETLVVEKEKDHGMGLSLEEEQGPEKGELGSTSGDTDGQDGSASAQQGVEDEGLGSSLQGEHPGGNGCCVSNQMPGLPVPGPDVIFQLKRGDEPWLVEFHGFEGKEGAENVSLDWETKPEIQGASEEEKSEGSLKENLGRKGPPSPKVEVYVLDGRTRPLGSEPRVDTEEAAAPVASGKELSEGLSTSRDPAQPRGSTDAQPPAQNVAWPAARGVLRKAASGDARRALRRILGIVVQQRVRAGATQPRRLLDAFVARRAYSEGRGGPPGGGRRAAQRGSRERSRASRWTGAVDPRPLAGSPLPFPAVVTSASVERVTMEPKGRDSAIDSKEHYPPCSLSLHLSEQSKPFACRLGQGKDGAKGELSGTGNNVYKGAEVVVVHISGSHQLEHREYRSNGGSMMRDMAEAVTQWEQLNPPQGGEPKKPRNLVLLGLPISKPDVISQLESGEVLERKVSKAANPDWGTGPQSKEVTPEQDIPEEESTPGVLVERFPKESSSECEDSLKNQQENHEKHLIQERTL
ncbi:hypothetical protein E5288_WYG017345 [Bos mutus]|uniref:Uncharacterized protein n=1 Tax=Bos mutus TaxID=72004 RepID=A0A6B0RL24_9CETA|nr:hypothetical protein [Bos mutus]